MTEHRHHQPELFGPDGEPGPRIVPPEVAAAFHRSHPEWLRCSVCRDDTPQTKPPASPVGAAGGGLMRVVTLCIRWPYAYRRR